MDSYWVRFSNGLSITTYLDRAVQETIQSFSQLFHLLADVTSRVMLNVLRIKRLRVNC